MSNLVKLYVYQHLQDETTIDTFAAKTWEDFILVKVDFQDPDTLEGIQQAFLEYAEKHPEKQVVLFADDLGLEFYGVREEEVEEQ